MDEQSAVSTIDSETAPGPAAPVVEPPVEPIELEEDGGETSQEAGVGRRRWRVTASNWEIAQMVVTFAVVGVASLWVLGAMNPKMVLTDSTPNGGDMGAHVWAPAYLRDHLLPDLRLSGWSDDWYAGFPALQFYMVIPYLLIVLFDLVLPYGIAFKLVAVAGVVTLPISAWAFGRLARLHFPLPGLFAVAGMLYVLDFNWTIYGGNAASTLAGEFSFSMALSIGLVALGLVARGLHTGAHRGSAAVLIALSAMSHLIVGLFVATVAVLLLLAWGLTRVPRIVGVLLTVPVAVTVLIVGAGDARADLAFEAIGLAIVFATGVAGLVMVVLHERRRLLWLAWTGALAALLAGVWLIPFLWRRSYINDMGWSPLDGGVEGQPFGQIARNLFFVERLSIGWVLALAALGAVWALLQWRPVPVAVVMSAATFGLLFAAWPIGRIWHARLLPFWYLSVYLLAAFGVVAVAIAVLWFGRLVLGTARRDDLALAAVPGVAREPSFGLALSGGLVVLALIGALLFSGLHLRKLGAVGGHTVGGAGADAGNYRVGFDSGGDQVLAADSSPDDFNFVPGWARWNFSGYERKPAYPEYYAIVQTMDALGAERGCGRAMWEYGREHLDRYGTPMALMLLPHWTDGCIGSMEGLYFEGSNTVPYHFLMQSELSKDPSRPMSDLPYQDLDLDLGVRHMQMFGVKYYMAFSPEAVEQARAHADLVEVATSDQWVVFEVQDAPLVAGLDYEPVIVDGISGFGREWSEPTAEWFVDPDRLDVPYALDGPARWQSVPSVDLSRTHGDGGIAEFQAAPDVLPRRELPPVQVSNIEKGNDSLSFQVDEVGVPVLVKISYFPNWSVEGAEGPYRVSPNLMVVIPTSRQVVMTYRRTAPEWIGVLSTVVGLAGIGFVGFRGRLRLEPLPVEGEEPTDEDLEATTFWRAGRAGGDESLDFTSAFFGEPIVPRHPTHDEAEALRTGSLWSPPSDEGAGAGSGTVEDADAAERAAAVAVADAGGADPASDVEAVAAPTGDVSDADDQGDPDAASDADVTADADVYAAPEAQTEAGGVQGDIDVTADPDVEGDADITAEAGGAGERAEGASPAGERDPDDEDRPPHER